ncbi:hypothetical protein PAECIP111891_04251 [Paenibacillus allorhizoplanae]|uniref:DUF1835 domain-containing protein n=1 Tax=Paenibacillus allorhizoplanae TaxID=2905648 RepID=A0ABN8GQG1_9BACL|nr:DUF1835 domain-containing protein [Paenibacillus allorhizoplanae]CAH1215549.1 hypothetical protein PAECIP111891_04251 [Paenibacillus allorhizoplanae]
MPLTTLHIVNGDAFGDKLRASGINGEILVWHESLYEGPIGMQMSHSALLSMRATYMNNRYGIPEDTFKSQTIQQEAKLDTLTDEVDEVVLWFEHDLYDQLMLCYLLSRIDEVTRRPFQLSLICIDGFPGIDPFYGLGQLTVDQILYLHGTWLPVSENQHSLACKVWTAYSAPEPMLMATLLDEDLSGLPFLKKALEAHIARFPSMQNGLSAIQQLTLELIVDDEVSVLSLFQTISEQASHYGLGDLQFFGILNGLWHCEHPLIQVLGGERLPRYNEAWPPQFENYRVKITEMGKLILTCEQDYIFLNGIDDWIGGVHLHGRKDVWRRNAVTAGFSKL